MGWYQRRFSDPDAVTLSFILLFGFAAIMVTGDILAPVLVAIVIAYLLEWPVMQLVKVGTGRTFAVSIVLLIFTCLTFGLIFGFIPLLWQQGVNLASELPAILEQVQQWAMAIPQQYPTLIQTEQVENILDTLSGEMLHSGQDVISASLNSLVDLMALLIYLVLVPLMIFFMLKDKDDLLRQSLRFLPRKRRLAIKVWSEMNLQIGNYIQGKVIEVVIVGTASIIAFVLLDLRYAVLLGAAVGLSVLIPYIGAAVVTIPVAVVGLFQFGTTNEFWYVMIVYGIIQVLDGNVLVPVLFSQAMNLHPVFIIIAVLFFGGLWGFWGVFFAIPLATLVKAVINAWPIAHDDEAQIKQPA